MPNSFYFLEGPLFCSVLYFDLTVQLPIISLILMWCWDGGESKNVNTWIYSLQKKISHKMMMIMMMGSRRINFSFFLKRSIILSMAMRFSLYMIANDNVCVCVCAKCSYGFAFFLKTFNHPFHFIHLIHKIFKCSLLSTVAFLLFYFWLYRLVDNESSQPNDIWFHYHHHHHS